MSATALKKLQYARARVVQAHAFFGALLLRQQLVEAPHVETMATDGDHLFFSPAFVEGCTPEHLHAVIAHEALHPALCHHTRRGNREPGLWNQATDYAINPILVKAGFHLPEGALIRDDLTAIGQAEKIYAKLLSERPPPPPADDEQNDDDSDERSDDQGGSQGAGGDDESPSDGGDSSDDATGGQATVPDYGGMGALLDAPVADDVERAAEDAKWRVAVMQAALTAGDVPAELQQAIAATVKPRDDWREITRRFVSQLSDDDDSWAVPNRRFVAQGLYLPSAHSEKLRSALIVIDSSGSISDELLQRSVDDGACTLEDCGLKILDVVTHDTQPSTVQRFERGDDVIVRAPGRGGTFFRPVLDLIERAEERYDVVLWFTDLQAADWHHCKAPSTPLLWIDFSDGAIEPPFGDDVVRMPS